MTLAEIIDAIRGRARLVATQPHILDQDAATVRDAADEMHVDLFDPDERRAFLFGLALMAAAIDSRDDGLRTAGAWWAAAEQWERVR